MLRQLDFVSTTNSYNGPTSITRSGWRERSVWVNAGTRGNKSFIRFDFAHRITIETFRPVIFCCYLIFRLLVSSTSHRPSAIWTSSPFFLAPNPVFRTVSHSWPSAIRVPFQIIDQSLERDAGTSENGFATVDIGILDNDTFRVSSHSKPPACEPIITLLCKYRR